MICPLFPVVHFPFFLLHCCCCCCCWWLYLCRSSSSNSRNGGCWRSVCCFSPYVSFGFCVFNWDFVLPPRITWVHPSSLLGLSLVSVLGSSSGEIVITVVVVVVVDVDDISLVILWGQVLEKCPSCLQLQQWGFLLWATTFIFWFSYSIVCGIDWNPVLFHMVK